jgi:hypothetical protein
MRCRSEIINQKDISVYLSVLPDVYSNDNARLHPPTSYELRGRFRSKRINHALITCITAISLTFASMHAYIHSPL